MTFNSLGLADQLLRAVQEEGYQTPSEIQKLAIPAALQKKDILAAAQTGSGKTAGFALPVLQHILSKKEAGAAPALRALIVVPTRELAAQIYSSIQSLGKYSGIKSFSVTGGVNIRPQIQKLKQDIDILVATPGRLLDLHKQGAVNLKKIEISILDEADKMLDMGFIHDIRKILKILPVERQNMLFSATFSPEIKKLASGFIKNPIHIDVSPKGISAASICQSAYMVDQSDKTEFLCSMIQNDAWEQVLIFTKTKHGANRLSKKLLQRGISSDAIHGNKSMNARTKALNDFKIKKVRALVATDIAARGIDIINLPHVVNFELPFVAEDYVHRIGRTGRAGKSGIAVSLVSPEEKNLMRSIEKLLNRKIPYKIPDKIGKN